MLLTQIDSLQNDEILRDPIMVAREVSVAETENSDRDPRTQIARTSFQVFFSKF